eukprot:scaffold20234_cov62-Phaeocystis_antarctica.AAC.3
MAPSRLHQRQWRPGAAPKCGQPRPDSCLGRINASRPYRPCFRPRQPGRRPGARRAHGAAADGRADGARGAQHRPHPGTVTILAMAIFALATLTMVLLAMAELTVHQPTARRSPTPGAPFSCPPSTGTTWSCRRSSASSWSAAPPAPRCEWPYGRRCSRARGPGGSAR